MREWGVVAAGLAVAVLGLAGCAPALAAPPYLVASWPVNGARVSISARIVELTFNRALHPIETWATVLSDDGGVTLRSRASLDPADERRLQVRVVDPLPGSFEVRWHAVAADSGLANDGVQSLVFRDDSPSPPRIDISPGPAESGERLELVGKGFAPNSPLALTIGDNASPLTTTLTDASGRFNLEAHVPPSVPLGVQPVSAIDAEGHLAVGSVEVRWGGWPPVIATDSGEPGPTGGEVTFTLTPHNLSDYVLEHVRVVLKDPDGAELVGADPGAHRLGATLEWEIPVMERGAFGPYHATYRASQPVVSHAWIEFRHRHERGCVGGDCLPAFISNTVADSAPVAPAR
ncbi:MAG TPA: copper resistance protein CopC [Chloroflexota bacterium]|jgi:methionine-rich copper-binding protein CopC